MDPILEVKGLYKVVGENSKRAFPLIGIDVETGSVTKQGLGTACALAPDPLNPVEMQNEQIHLNLIHQSFIQVISDDVLQAESPDDILHFSSSSSAKFALQCVKAASLLTTKIISRNKSTVVAKANNPCCKQNVSEVCNINLPFIHLLKTSYGNHYEKLN